MLYKGRLKFKQYIPSKHNRFGVKTYVLYDCTTGFVLDFIIYVGEGTAIVHEKNLGASGSIVWALMNSYLDRGHILYVNKWYSSLILFQQLTD